MYSIGNPEKYKVLEEKVDVNIQIQFYSEVKKGEKGEKLTEDEIIQNEVLLYNPKSTLKLKKMALINLALVKTVPVYRILERFAQSSNSENVKGWALLAKNFSQMMVENNLSKEKTVFVSSGLGGKLDKLRYLVVFVAKNGNDYSEVQQKIIVNELKFYFPQFTGEFETIKFYGKYAVIKCLANLQPDIREIVNHVLMKCNELGEFIDENYLVTNVKDLSIEEIEDFLSNNGAEKLLNQIKDIQS